MRLLSAAIDSQPRPAPLHPLEAVPRRLSPLVETDTSCTHGKCLRAFGVCRRERGGVRLDLDPGGGSGLSEVDAASRRGPPFVRFAHWRTRAVPARLSTHLAVIPSPCATMAPLLRFAPPGCNALHVEGIPSLRGGLGCFAPAAASPHGPRQRAGGLPATARRVLGTLQRGHDRLCRLGTPCG